MEHVILLHGLARRARSLLRMEGALRDAGYSVDNVSYPSREAEIEELAWMVFPAVLETAEAEAATAIHFVTHSMGGILLRYYMSVAEVPKFGRAVMLAPPNQGSEVVDHLRDRLTFKLVNGPAGRQLGTDAESLPLRLGAVHFPCGVIAGSRTINWINSWRMLPGTNDGKVTVERTCVEGMADHLVVPVTHPLIMRDKRVIAEVLHFLREGRFRG